MTTLAKIILMSMPFISLRADWCYADQSNPLYQQAKAAYDQDDCATALPLLGQYVEQDQSYLNSHPEILTPIKKAQAYCDLSVLSATSIGGTPRDFGSWSGMKIDVAGSIHQSFLQAFGKP